MFIKRTLSSLVVLSNLSLAALGCGASGMDESSDESMDESMDETNDVSELAVQAGDQYPTYTQKLYLESDAATSASISFGDIDKDGDLDVVLGKGRHWALKNVLLLNNGAGQFAAQDLPGAADRTYSSLLADMNGDGKLDIVVTNDAPDTKRVLLNKGLATPQFTPTTFGSGSWESRYASVADMNGDGKLDIIVANRDSTGNRICLNQGQGVFGSSCTAFAPYPATTITPGDFNKDGKMDLVVPHRNGGQSYVYFGNGSGVSGTRRKFGPAGAKTRATAVADFNGDGKLDIAAIEESTGVSVYFGGSAAFTNGPKMGGYGTPHAVIVGDLDKDGRPDIVVGYENTPSQVFFNTGNAFAAREFSDSAGPVYGFAIGDVDKDGVLDIGVARSNARNVIYFGAK